MTPGGVIFIAVTLHVAIISYGGYITVMVRVSVDVRVIVRVSSLLGSV